MVPGVVVSVLCLGRSPCSCRRWGSPCCSSASCSRGSVAHAGGHGERLSTGGAVRWRRRVRVVLRAGARRPRGGRLTGGPETSSPLRSRRSGTPRRWPCSAEVLHEMGDLPRAGAMWFAAGAQGPEVDAAVAAWREQAQDDFAAMWRSLPASARAEPRPRRIEALRERALRCRCGGGGGRGDRARRRPQASEASEGSEDDGVRRRVARRVGARGRVRRVRGDRVHHRPRLAGAGLIRRRRRPPRAGR